MTKILMTSVRDDEQTAINEYAKEHNIEIYNTLFASVIISIAKSYKRV